MEFFFLYVSMFIELQKWSKMKKYKGGKTHPDLLVMYTYIPQIIDYFVKFFHYNPVFSVNLKIRYRRAYYRLQWF
jgi:hypothetical protein